MQNGQGLHRRKSSKDEDENVVLVESPVSDLDYNDNEPLYGTQIEPSQRNRTLSSPHTGHSRSVSFAGGVPPSPFRTGFNLPRSPNGVNGHIKSPLGPTFNAQLGQGHSRTRSTSTPFSPTLSSPLSGSFPMNGVNGRGTSSLISAPTMYAFPSAIALSQSAPESSQDASLPAPTPNHPRRHSRLHSRNLSIFFPRPGSLPHAVISEDGGQEIEVSVDEEAPSVEIPAAGSSVRFPSTRDVRTPLGQGFTFGARPPSTGPVPSLMTDSGESSSHHSSTSASRRGHHHRHSISHNFFSFLEPVRRPAPGEEPQELITEPAPVPLSPWVPMSAIASTATEDKKVIPHNGHADHDHDHDHDHNRHHRQHQPREHRSHNNGEASIPVVAAVAGTGQFLLGAWLWVQGQQIGSLSVTGLGYWVVFDAFGVGLSEIAPKWLASDKGSSFNEREKAALRRPYGYVFRVINLLLYR